MPARDAVPMPPLAAKTLRCNADPDGWFETYWEKAVPLLIRSLPSSLPTYGVHDVHRLLQRESRSNRSTPHMATIIIIIMHVPGARASRVRTNHFSALMQLH